MPGLGSSSPIVWGDTVVITSVWGCGPQGQLTVSTYDRVSGAELLARHLGRPVGTHARQERIRLQHARHRR